MESPPRVLFINHSVRDGGPGRSLFYILKYLDKTKIDLFVLVPKEDVFTDMVKNEGLGDRIIVERKFPENVLRPRLDWPWLRKDNEPPLLTKFFKILSVVLNIIDLAIFVISSPFLMKRKRIKIIYCNGTVAKIVGALMGVFSRCPVVWHVRNIQQTKALWLTINLLSSLPLVKKIICVSGPTADQFHLSRGKIVVIHNGIDPEDFDPEKTTAVLRYEFNIPEGAILVGSTGRIVPRKGYEYLIRSAHAVKNGMGSNINKVRFVIVGDTPYFFQDNHLQFLKGLVSDYGLQDFFIFTGYKRDVRPYLKDFDIFVIPSNYPDPFPRVVIEAMSFGLPVVGFRVGGIVEAVENGVSGILNEPGNIEQMGDSISRLITDRSLRLSMGASGRERVWRLFSAEDRSRDVEENILEVAKKYTYESVGE